MLFVVLRCFDVFTELLVALRRLRKIRDVRVKLRGFVVLPGIEVELRGVDLLPVILVELGRFRVLADFDQHPGGALPVLRFEVHVGRALPLLELLVKPSRRVVLLGVDIEIDRFGVPLRFLVEARRPRDVSGLLKTANLALELHETKLLAPDFVDDLLPNAQFHELCGDTGPYEQPSHDDDEYRQKDVDDRSWQVALEKVEHSFVCSFTSDKSDGNPKPCLAQHPMGEFANIVASVADKVKAARSQEVTGFPPLTEPLRRV